MKEKLINLLIEKLNPKYYHKLTWLIVGAGLTLFSNSIISLIINQILQRKYDIKIINENDGLFGLALVIIGVAYNSFIYFLEFKKEVITNDRHAEIEEIKSHDRDLFKKSDEIWDEEKITRFLNLLGGSHETHDNFMIDLSKYIDFFKRTSNSFLTKEIENSKNAVRDDFEKLGHFIGLNFWTHRLRTEISQLHPDLNIDRAGRHVSHEDELQYHKYVQQLIGHIDKCENSYKEFRLIVKTKLKV